MFNFFKKKQNNSKVKEIIWKDCSYFDLSKEEKELFNKTIIENRKKNLENWVFNKKLSEFDRKIDSYEKWNVMTITYDSNSKYKKIKFVTIAMLNWDVWWTFKIDDSSKIINSFNKNWSWDWWLILTPWQEQELKRVFRWFKSSKKKGIDY